MPTIGRRASVLVAASIWILAFGVSTSCASEEPTTRAAAASAAPKEKASRFIAPNGSDAGRCKKKAPCASFNRAYQVAEPGEIVEVAGGTYPAQQIWAAPGKTAPNVVFRPAAGQRVILSAGLEFGEDNPASGPDFITVTGMATGYKEVAPAPGNQYGVFVGPGSSHITLERIDAGSFHVWKADHITIKGGDYGPCHVVHGASNVCGNTNLDISSNVTVSGALFHDYRFDETCFGEGADCHYECMYVNGGVNITIRNSRFRDCALSDLFATISGPDAAAIGHRNLTIENNWFDTPWDEDTTNPSRSRASAVVLANCQNSPNGYRDVLVRFNSFQASTRLEHDSTIACVYENVRVIGNLMMWDGCDPRYTYAYNLWSTVWRRGSCSPTDRIGARTFPYATRESGPGFNFHLAGGRRTLADGLVPPSVLGGCPGIDMDGERRPLDNRCDAGADERTLRR